jgi:dimethylhistidine N-methyltransferase
MTDTMQPAVDREFLEAVEAGLGSTPKTLPCRYFYDLEGSLLFEEICDLPEYYVTRTEDRILRERAGEIAGALEQTVDLVELGSGSSRKTRLLIHALLRKQEALRYVPVDISAEMLAQTAEALAREYPRLTVEPLVGEYAEAMARLRAERQGPMLVLFLGSNLGNFRPEEAVEFLRRIRAMMASDDRLLLGLDLRKDRAVLEAAYDDAAGVTARFNLNLLRRINRELGGAFDLDSFTHRAVFNEEEGRVEMHLVSTRAQGVRVAGRSYRFEAGETIHTENSYKYTLPQVRALAGEAGLALEQTWRDEDRLFSLNFLRPS